VSNENEDLMRQLVLAFNERDTDSLLALTSPDFEFAPYLATLLETTVYRGHAGLGKYFEDADAAWEAIEVRLDDFREVDPQIAVVSGVLRGKGKTSGLEVEVPLAWVAEFRAGKAVRLITYTSKPEALEAVGLSE
jgi:ketosteroid isomerase-like protein